MEGFNVTISKPDVVIPLVNNGEFVGCSGKAYRQIVAVALEDHIVWGYPSSEFDAVIFVEVLVADRLLDTVRARPDAENVSVAAIPAAHDVITSACLKAIFECEAINDVIARGGLIIDRARIEALPRPDFAICKLDPLDPAV